MTPNDTNQKNKKNCFVEDFVRSASLNSNELLGALIKEFKMEHKMPI